MLPSEIARTLGRNFMSEVATTHPAPPNERQAMTGRIIVLGSMESPIPFDSHTFGGGLHDAHPIGRST